MTEARIVSSARDKYRIFELLRGHLKPIPNTEFYVYDEGWDDERVAKEVNPKLTAGHVIRLRLNAIGELRQRPKPAGQGKLRGDINDLLIAHNALCDSLGAVQFKVTLKSDNHHD